MKKTIIAIVVMATLFATAYAATRSFTDVSTTDWFYNDVMNMADWNVIQGYPDGTFGPANNVNRAELSAMWNRYDTHVADKINQAVTNISLPSSTTSTQTSTELENMKVTIGNLYLALATTQVSLSANDFQAQFNNARFNDLGSSYPVNCSAFDLSKNLAKAYIARARDFTTVSTTEENNIVSGIDNYKNLCNSL